jgi:hypothetical protein
MMGARKGGAKWFCNPRFLSITNYRNNHRLFRRPFSGIQSDIMLSCCFNGYINPLLSLVYHIFSFGFFEVEKTINIKGYPRLHGLRLFFAQHVQRATISLLRGIQNMPRHWAGVGAAWWFKRSGLIISGRLRTGGKVSSPSSEDPYVLRGSRTSSHESRVPSHGTEAYYTANRLRLLPNGREGCRAVPTDPGGLRSHRKYPGNSAAYADQEVISTPLS